MQEVLLNGRLGEAAALLACVTAVSPKSAASQYSRCLCVTKVTAVATGTCVSPMSQYHRGRTWHQAKSL